MPLRPELRDALLDLMSSGHHPDDMTATFDAVVVEHGWPGLRAVGADGVDAAWWVATHATDVALQRSWLPALAEAVGAGDADPRHLATLTDLVADAAGEPQVYGTLALLAADGEVELMQPAVDPGQLDDRRAAIGLPPLAEEAPYLADGELVPFGAQRRDLPVLQWPIVLEGHVSVEAALEGGKRPVHRIWATRPGDRRLGRLRALARERGVLIDQVGPEVIDDLAGGRSHGGVLGIVGPRRTLSVQSLLAGVGERPFIVMLDGVEDPFNFGQAIRALYAAGVDGVVTRRAWETATATVTRASAGASELLPTGHAASADDAAAASRAAGLRVACAVSDGDADELADADLSGGLFLLIGGERRGVTRSFVDQADQRIRIGYGRERAPELGAAISAAVIGFAALRQRRAERT